MAIVVPDRTAGSLGTTKSNANPVTNEPQQLTADQYNESADKLIEVINQSNNNESTSQRIIWEWNGSDVSQFSGVSYYGSVGAATASLALQGAGAISPHPNGNKIRVNGGAGVTAGDALAVFWANDPLPFPDNARNYKIVMNSDFSSSDAIVSYSPGVIAFGDRDSGDHGYAVASGNGKTFRVDNGTLVSGVDLATGLGDSAILYHTIRGRKPSSGDPAGNRPHFQWLFERRFNPSDNSFFVLRNNFDANDGNWLLGSLPPASWNDLDCDRWGIMVYAASGFAFANGGNWDINDIKIFANMDT
jgi:hypothetical protein